MLNTQNPSHGVWLKGELVVSEPLPKTIWPINLPVSIFTTDLIESSEEEGPPCVSLKCRNGTLLPLIRYSKKAGFVASANFNSMRRRLLDEEYCGPLSRPLISYLPFDYNLIPGTLKNIALELWRLLKRQPDKREYLSDLSATALAKLDCVCKHGLAGINPDHDKREKGKFFLTYDMDLGWLFHNDAWFDRVMESLSEMQITATFFVVPAYCKGKAIEKKLRQIFDQGHEIGLHGTTHELKLPFMKSHEIRRQFSYFMGFMDEYNIKGFRAPWLLTSPVLEEILPEIFSYDTSIPMTNIIGLRGNLRGCCSSSPFIRRKHLPELPITLPCESELIILGFSASGIFSQWQFEVEKLKQVDGTAVFFGHWDPKHLATEEMFSFHINFLKSLKEDWKLDVKPCDYMADFLRT